MPKELTRASAVRFVVLMGIISLLADVTYEGARSISGPYLALLGASGTIVGIVAGFGELIGYGLRLLSGIVADRTQRYWFITFFGYAVNLLAVPALALTGQWQIAAALLVTERVGKAIRTPARDAMLSHATARTGHGWGFGLHEAMDQIGAVLGPTLMAGGLYLHKGYQRGFAFLLIPALLALGCLTVARILFPEPRDFEVKKAEFKSKGMPKAFWIYLIAAACVAAGYADFPLVAYHLKQKSIAADDIIPLLYALAMGVDAVAALIFGRWFDRRGIFVLIPAAVLSSLFAPLVFMGNQTLAMIGMGLWGIGMGAQESVMRAAVATMVPSERRGSAYGIFNAAYGVMWFAGSALMGALYDISIPGLVAFSFLIQLLSVPFFLFAHSAMNRHRDLGI